MAFWLWLFIALALALALAVVAIRRTFRAERTLFEQRRELLELRRMVQILADRLGERWPGTQPARSPASEQAGEAGAPIGSSARSVDWNAPAPAAPPFPVTPSDSAETPAASPMLPSVPQSGPASWTPPTLPPPEPAAGRRSPSDARSLESDIGGRWLLYIGIAALVIGVSYFLKYAFDNEWIGEHARVIIGVIGGVALTLLGGRFVQAGHALYGQALCGGGFGIVYLSIYAAHRWYEILSSPLAFTSMVATTAVAAWQADRQRSQALALLAVIVGFATPFLVGSDEDAHVTLFTYDAILVGGTLFLARRREWPALNLVSYVLTVMTIVLWADRAYRPRMYLSVELFLTLFLALFLAMLRENRRIQTASARLATMLLALAPVLYHFGSLANLRPHMGPLLVYLIGFTVGGIIAARQLRAPWIRVLVFFGAAFPFMDLADHGFARSWVTAAWITTIAIYGAHLVAQMDALGDASGEDRLRMSAAEMLLLHANGLWLLYCLQSLLAPRAQSWSAPVAFGLAAWYGGLAFAARSRRGEAALHATALASAMVAIGCALRFDGPALVVAIAAEGAVLVWLALRSSRIWLQVWGGLLLAMAVLRALVLLADPVPVAYVPLVNPRAVSCFFIVGALYVLAWMYARRQAARPLVRHTLVVAANVLTLMILSAEIDAYFDRRGWIGRVEGAAEVETSAALARQLALSIVWAVYAVALVAIGIWRDYRPVRYLAIIIFAFTIVKVFVVDIATLDRVYKMLSVMVLGILLLVASYLYQRLRAPDASFESPNESPQA
jgi:uncharacterized membrane protein